MAKKQTRRCVSLNRSDYEAAKLEAARRGVSLSALVETGLAAIGVAVVEHPQLTPEQVRASAAGRAASAAARQVAAHRPSRERQMLGDRVADACGFA
jgi:hypothetical protein